MKILIYGINYFPELTGIGKYSGEMATWLASQGHQVRVITAPPYYPSWKIADGYSSWRCHREHINGVLVWRCPLWVPSRPTGITRILHLTSFAITSLPVLLKQVFWRPDIVMTIEPPLICAPQAWLAARLSGATAWLHIQDFEIEAFFGLTFLSSPHLRRLLTAVEALLMRRFDHVSTISKSMQSRIIRSGVDRGRMSLVPNWVDTALLRPGASKVDLRSAWGLTEKQPLVLYSGNMGKKQGLEIVLEAAEQIQTSHPDVRFLLVGEGAAKAELAEKAEHKKLKNVLFKPLQPLDRLPALLSMADVHLVIQKRGAAEAVMPSKLTGILAAGGHSIITADWDTELGRLVSENPGIAELVEPEDPNALAAAVRQLLEKTKGSGRVNQVARSYAKRYLDQRAILMELERDLVRASGATAPPPSSRPPSRS